jgi:DNA-binding response OmpR family regulator
MRAIIIEDNALIAMDLECALTDAGYDVVARLPCYRSALEWISAHPPPEACVLDLDLGGGRDAAKVPGEEGRRLLAIMTHRSVPTVLYSGHSRDDAKLNGLDAQAAFVSKTEPPSKVILALRGVTGNTSP